MKKGDYIVLGSLLAVLVISFICFFPFSKETQNVTAVIRIDGNLYATYKLTKNYKNIVEINSEFGYNKLEIDCGKVRMIDASCKDKLDVKMRWIEKPFQSIVCLPNKLIVSIEGDTDFDYVSY